MLMHFTFVRKVRFARTLTASICCPASTLVLHPSKMSMMLSFNAREKFVYVHGYCSAQSLQMQSVWAGISVQSSQSMYCVHASQRSPPQRSHSAMGPESTARQLWHFTAALREVRRGVGMRQSIRFS